MTSRSDASLERCPFCGGAADYQSRGWLLPRVRVRCSHCETVSAWYLSHFAAALHWNRRAGRVLPRQQPRPPLIGP